MHTASFEVLSPDEVARIHASSLVILADVGITLAERIKLWSYATSLGHAHSLLFFIPPTCMSTQRPISQPTGRPTFASGPAPESYAPASGWKRRPI